MKKIDDELLSKISDLHSVPQGAYNIRKNGELLSRNSTENIEIITKKDNNGIDIIVKPNTINQSIHIPVLLTIEDFTDLVYNDFYIGDNSVVTIIAGCGIHNDGKKSSEHNGIHSFHIGKNCTILYKEKHLGIGSSKDKILNPKTIVDIGENSLLIFETIQLGGVSYSKRTTEANLQNNSRFEVKEIIKTSNNDYAQTIFNVNLNGENCRCEVKSRSVAENNSKQIFESILNGNNSCYGRVECNAIIKDNAKVNAIPQVNANHYLSELYHEASVGKIAGEQLIKLMTLGLTENEAEQLILKGFLK